MNCGGGGGGGGGDGAMMMIFAFAFQSLQIMSTVWMPRVFTVYGPFFAALSRLIIGSTHALSWLLRPKREADYAPVCNIRANIV